MEIQNWNWEGPGTREAKNKTKEEEQGAEERQLLHKTEADFNLIFCNFHLIDQDDNGQGIPKTMPKKTEQGGRMGPRTEADLTDQTTCIPLSVCIAHCASCKS